MADDDDKTGFRVIEGDANPALERVTYMVGSALRELTANLLRVTRGAGRDYEIPTQAIALIEALQEYVKQRPNHLPNLGGFLTEGLGEIDFDTPRPVAAKYDITRGVLQIVASRLLGQDLQERHGEKELNDGLRRWDEAIAEVRRRREEERRKAGRT
jgi:hypothetical protein